MPKPLTTKTSTSYETPGTRVQPPVKFVPLSSPQKIGK